MPNLASSRSRDRRTEATTSFKERCRRHRSDAGDTLVEVLLALVVIGLAGVAIIGSFTTSISAASEHKNLALLDAATKTYVETAQSAITARVSPLFKDCTVTTTPETTYGLAANIAWPTSYTVSYAATQFWQGNGWGSSCLSPPHPAQLLTVTITGKGGSETTTFVVRDPAYSPAKAAAPTTVTNAASNTVVASYSELTTVPFSIQFHGNGFPTPAMTATLPSGTMWTGLSFTDNGDGFGTLSGDATVGLSTVASGLNPDVPCSSDANCTVTIPIVATNSLGTSTQTITILFHGAPELQGNQTTGTSATSTVTPASNVTTTYTVVSTAEPAATLALTVTVPGVTLSGNVLTVKVAQAACNATTPCAVEVTATNAYGIATLTYSIQVPSG